MDIRQLGSQPGQYVDGHLAFVDKGLALALGRDFPAQEQHAVLGVHVQFFQNSLHPGLIFNIENGLDPVGIGPLAQIIHGSPAAQHNAEGINENGFAGTGFPGKHIEARGEIHPQVVNQGKIMYFQ